MNGWENRTKDLCMLAGMARQRGKRRKHKKQVYAHMSICVHKCTYVRKSVCV